MTEHKVPGGPIPLPYAVIGLAGALYGWAVFATTFRYPGAIGLNYDAVGSDYMVFHLALSLAWHGNFTALYDPVRFTAILNDRFHDILSHPVVFRPWVYPPSFLVLLLPFGALPFRASFWAFQACSAGLMVAAIRSVLPRGNWRLALAVLLAPAASITAVSGQSTFLVIALLITGARLLDGKPVIAGMAWGVLSFKPQFAILLPIALIAARAWRSLAACIAMAVAMVLLACALFGPEVLLQWFQTEWYGAASNPLWIETGLLWGDSVFTCAFLLGLPRAGAIIVQLAASAFAAAWTYWAFSRGRTPTGRIVALLPAVLLAAPHCGNYDLLMVAVAALLLWQSRPPSSSLGCVVPLLAWLMPLFGQPALSTMACFGPLLTIGVLLAGQPGGMASRGG